MSELATYKFDVEGLDCANCAAHLEEKIKGIEGIENVSLSFMNHSLVYDCDHDEAKLIEEKVRTIIKQEEPEVTLTSKGHHHHHEHEHLHHHDHDHCSCAHEHHHHEHHEEEIIETSNTRKYRIDGLDCADCASKLEHALSKIEGVSHMRVSFINSCLSFDCDKKDEERILKEIKEVTMQEEPEAHISNWVTQHKHEETKEENDWMLYRLIIGAILFFISLFLEGIPMIIVALLSYLILGYDVIVKAFKGIGRGQIFDEHFLMSIATFAAIYLKDYKEATAVMLFYQVGEYFQELAVKRSRKSIGDLMDIRPDYAVVKRNDEWIRVSPEDVNVNEIILVKPGERVPLDGIIQSGASSLNTASLTGESKLRDVDINDEVMSGSVNETGVLEIQVSKPYHESTVSRILDLVENQETKKSSHEQFITKFSRIYTPLVVITAIIVMIVVSLLGLGIEEGIRRACTFLVISCPCALVISIPLSFFAGIGGLSSRGVLVKGANMIEPLANTNYIVMDKTGTLTSGIFKVEKTLHTSNEKELLQTASIAEHYSNHPIALGIKEKGDVIVNEDDIQEVEEIAGRGLKVNYKNDVFYVGNARLLNENGIECEEEKEAGTLVYVAKNKEYLGCIVLNDQLKEDAKETIQKLQEEGKKCILISGDNQELTKKVANELNVDDYQGGCLPEDKVHYVEELKKKGLVSFVGDGVNDAPVITNADIGFAMGALGSDAAIEAADIVIMDDSPSKLSLAISSAKRILKVANQNIYGAIIIKIIVLILGALGYANMWMAIFADTGVALLCVLNSLRLLHIARK